MHTIVKDLNWRYATKKFDSSKKVSNEDLDVIKESLRLTATSYGIQPLQFILVESPELRKRLRAASYGQSQVTDASHLIVLCSYIDVNDSHIDEYVNNISTTRSVSLEEIAGFGNYMKETVVPMSAEAKAIWTSKQAYIALGQAMHTCATLRIDSIPMEGFDPSAYDEILGLSDQNLKATLVLAIGYRHADDETQHWTKVRKAADDIFTTV